MWKLFDDGKLRPLPDHLNRTGYRLPTEAEWEFACRAGSQTARFYGHSPKLLGKYAWYFDNSDGRTWPVGLLKPNDLGLFDILGNVTELCVNRSERFPAWLGERVHLDLAADYAIEQGDSYLARGGSFDGPEGDIRSAAPFGSPANIATYTYGFRVARTLSR
jgi:formylglycine-generating enzyme required for sulfatase activity